MLLVPVSKLYGAIVGLRNWCYDMKFIRSVKVGVPVISVGNMTAGGTGKTPFVEYLIRSFLKQHKTVGVVSRGYERTSKGMVVVSDGTSLLSDQRAAGDEPYQMARKFRQAVVIVDERRSRGAQAAIDKYAVEVIILDDGYQHRALFRDLDIVMIDGTRPLADIRLLPAGLRREPMIGLRRAHLVGLSGRSVRQEVLAQLRTQTSAPIFSLAAKGVVFKGVFDGSERELTEMTEISCTAFCGIGNPEAFRTLLDDIGLKIKHFIAFDDHHRYTPKNVTAVMRIFDGAAGQCLVTTEKDAVRLRSEPENSGLRRAPFYYLEIEATVSAGADVLRGSIDALFRKAS